MPYCKKCGNELQSGQLVCQSCGQNQNQIVEAEPQREKVTASRLIWMWVFAAGGGVIGIILASTILAAKNPDGTPRYAKSNRTQAIIGLILSIVMGVLFVLLYSSLGMFDF